MTGLADGPVADVKACGSVVIDGRGQGDDASSGGVVAENAAVGPYRHLSNSTSMPVHRPKTGGTGVHCCVHRELLEWQDSRHAMA